MIWEKLKERFSRRQKVNYEGKVYLLTNYSEYRGSLYEPDYIPIVDSFASSQIRRFTEFITGLYNRHGYGQSLSDKDAADEANRLAFLRGSRRYNSIRTTKYSLLSFLPRVLFFQLTRVGNLIFLGVSFLQLIKDVSDSNGLPTYLIPLIFVIAVCIVREMISDLTRWRSDEEENRRLVHVFRDGKLKEMKLRDIRVGDIVKVYAYEYFPSDLVLLNCSDEQGVCNIETKNADGESNVKYKHVVPELAELFRNDEDAGRAHIKLVCEAQTDSLNSFSGVAYYSHDDLEELQSRRLSRLRRLSSNQKKENVARTTGTEATIHKVPLYFDQLLLRGTSMVNTEWAYCVAVYVGNETRLLKGSVDNSKRKSSKLENMYQRNLSLVLMIMIVCVISSALLSIYWLLNESRGHTYLTFAFDGSPVRSFFVTIGSMTLLLAAMIPVDLIIMWEIVRGAESRQICWNPEMVYAGKPAESKSDQLIEDLAHITHIYSDKTGTLTQNVMTLNALGFGAFGSIEQEGWPENFWNLYANGSKELRSMIRDFILVACLCHSVVIRKDDLHFKRAPKVLKEINGVTKLVLVDNVDVEYDAASPDELAILNGMALLGCKFSNRPSITEIELSLTFPEIQKLILTEEEYQLCQLHKRKKMVPALRFKVLDVVAFDSNRKCMSMVVEDTCGRLVTLCKGADSALLKIMKKDQQIGIEKLNKQLHDFACVGLRTLMFATRVMDPPAYEAWHEKYSEALQLGEEREEAIGKIVQELERQMNIVGSTAIEDLLQEDVGEVIRDLKEAGIVIWVLTGDKLETALSIGKSTNMISGDNFNAILSDPRPEVVKRELKKHLANCLSGQKRERELHVQEGVYEQKFSFGPSSWESARHRKSSLGEMAKFSITITGEVLQTVYESEELKEKFFKLAQGADTVIACRTTQKQKFELTRDNTNFNEHSTSLAIGDGANDVGMILTANVGVGIAGKEGTQACRSADFAIGQFRFLRQLLFVHGREALRKNIFLLYFCIFRNFSFSFVNVIYNFYTGFSGVSVFNTWSKQIINLCFTSFPLMCYVIFDRQLPQSLLLRYPILYNTWSTKPVNNLLRSLINPNRSNLVLKALKKRLDGRRGIYDPATFWGFIVAALWLSILETLIIVHIFDAVEFSVLDGRPLNFGFNLFSQTMYVHHVLAANAIVCLISKTWFWPNHFFLWGETVTLIVFWLIVSLVPAFAYIPEAHVFLGTAETLHSSISYYGVILLLLVVTLFPFWGYMYYTTIFNPSLEDQIALQLKNGTFNGVATLRRASVMYVADENDVASRDNNGFAFAIEKKDALLSVMQRTIHKLFKTGTDTCIKD